jgi:hypothetical protein
MRISRPNGIKLAEYHNIASNCTPIDTNVGTAYDIRPDESLDIDMRSRDPVVL